MARLKLKGSSLIEVVVSSVIMLVAFAISMDTLVRLTTTTVDAEEAVRMEMDLKECMKNDRIDAETLIYEWGEIERTNEYMGYGLYHVIYSVDNGRQNKIRFEKIVFNEKRF